MDAFDTDASISPINFRNILFLNFIKYIYTKLVWFIHVYKKGGPRANQFMGYKGVELSKWAGLALAQVGWEHIGRSGFGPI